jgi:hypothetical protein
MKLDKENNLVITKQAQDHIRRAPSTILYAKFSYTGFKTNKSLVKSIGETFLESVENMKKELITALTAIFERRNKKNFALWVDVLTDFGRMYNEINEDKEQVVIELIGSLDRYTRKARHKDNSLVVIKQSEVLNYEDLYIAQKQTGFHMKNSLYEIFNEKFYDTTENTKKIIINELTSVFEEWNYGDFVLLIEALTCFGDMPNSMNDEEWSKREYEARQRGLSYDDSCHMFSKKDREDLYIAFYAKNLVHGFNTQNPLYEVTGKTLLDVLKNMDNVYHGRTNN